MGTNTSALTDDQLKQYQCNTTFSRREICYLWDKFYEVCDIKEKVAKGESNTIRASFDQIKEMPELKENPFNQRICEVFGTASEVILDRGNSSAANNETNSLSFENFLDMVYIFSEQASLGEKIKHAFKIYDEDNDGYIGRDDLHSIVSLMTKKQSDISSTDQGIENKYLTDQEITIITNKIMEESDVDHDQRLSTIEFESIVLQAPHFVSVFNIRF